MCICTPSKRTPWCAGCPQNFVWPGSVKVDWHNPNKYTQAEVTPKMIEAGLAVFHKTYLDRDTQLIAVYRAMHEARA